MSVFFASDTEALHHSQINLCSERSKNMEIHEVRFLQGWSLQEGSSGGTSATLDPSGDICWGSLLFCFAAWIQWTRKMRWSILKHSLSLWSRSNQVNLCRVIMSFSNNFSVTWQALGHLMVLNTSLMDPMENNTVKNHWLFWSPQGLSRSLLTENLTQILPVYGHVIILCHFQRYWLYALIFYTEYNFFYRVKDVPGSEDM